MSSKAASARASRLAARLSKSSRVVKGMDSGRLADHEPRPRGDDTHRPFSFSVRFRPADDLIPGWPGEPSFEAAAHPYIGGRLAREEVQFNPQRMFRVYRHDIAYIRGNQYHRLPAILVAIGPNAQKRGVLDTDHHF